MSSIALAQLGEIADLQAGVGFPVDLQGRSSGDYPVAKVGDISRVGRSGEAVISAADHYIDEGDLARLRARPIPPGSVLFAKIGEAIRHNHRVIAGCALLVDNNAMAAIPTRRVESRYLYHFLRSVDFYGLTSATTVPALRKSELKRLPVPLPPLPEQRRIAEILDKADALRAKRRAALAYLDTLTQSIFLDMFGDPATNPKGWPYSRLGDVTDFYAGSTLPAGDAFDGQADGYFLLKVSDMNLAGNEVYLESCQQWSAEPGAASSTCPAASIVIPKRGGAIGTNKKRIAVRPSVLDPNLMAIWPRPDLIELSFLYSWLLRLDLASITSGSSVPQLNKRDLDPLSIPVPPLEAQCEFSHKFGAMEGVIMLHDRALSVCDTLFAALQHGAFQGEL